MVTLASFRREIELAPSVAYLNNAATSPTPRFVRRAVVAYEEDRSRRAEAGWDDWVRDVEAARVSTARYFRARAQEVAFLWNTGAGINTTAHMIPWRRGDEVVTNDLEFPSNLLPWRRLAARGVKVRVLKVRGDALDPGHLLDAIGPKTRLVALSWVSYRNGQRFALKPISEAVHRQGGFLFVDSIQGAGALRPDFAGDGIDFLANGGHKWLMAPFGVGCFLVRKELVGEFDPPFVGWQGLEDNEDFRPENQTFASTARRFEIGNLNYGGIAGWRASVEALQELLGAERRILANTQRLLDALDEARIATTTPRERDGHAGIVCARVAQPVECVAALATKRINASVRGSTVRLSPHFWATDEELDRAVAELARWQSRRGKA
jgi:selenocysteine lyase/cysteine desulfurase